MCEKLSDDPDEVLNALGIWPEVVLHGDRLYSMNNRRAYCIKNCIAPDGVRFWVKLYHSPDDYDRAYGRNAFGKYYSTTCAGESITLTTNYHKGELAREYGVERVFEGHVDFRLDGSADAVCADVMLLQQFNLFTIEKTRATQIVIRGRLQRDVDRASAFIEWRYERELPPAKRRREDSNAVGDLLAREIEHLQFRVLDNVTIPQ